MIQLLLLFLVSGNVFAKIEDNSFLLEEAYNQKPGEFQFIQRYQGYNSGREYLFSSEGEVPLGSVQHQFSYQINRLNVDGDHGTYGDTTLSYRYQSVNKEAFLMAHRLGVLIPTGSVQEESGYGVVGLEYMQAMTFILNEQWVNHWNLGFTHYSEGKHNDSDKRRTLNMFRAGTSLVYLLKDNLNFLLEGLLGANENLNLNEKKEYEKFFTLNPGVRTAIDFAWKETQLVPGIAFPIRFQKDRVEHGIFLYFSIEPQF